MSKFKLKLFIKKLLKFWNYFWGFLGGIALLVGLILGCINLYEKLFNPELIPITQFPKEYVFGSQNYYVQALTDTQNKVIAYAITTRDNNFNPIITILEHAGYVDPKDSDKTVMATTNITLGKTTFADLNINQENIYLDKPENIFASIGARRFYYQEEYYFGNPGDYQSYFFVINDSSITEYSDLPESFFKKEKLDPLNPEILEFRKKSIFNTFQVTSPGEGWNNKELRKYMAGPDYDQMRVIPESVLENKYSKSDQLKNLKKLSTEVDIQLFIDLLGKPIVINSEPTVYLRDGDKTVGERFEEEFNKSK